MRWYDVAVGPVDISRRQVLAKGGALALALALVGCAGSPDDGPNGGDVDDTDPNSTGDTEPNDTTTVDDTTTTTEPSDF